MIFLPVGLWLGALAIFLALRPLTAFALASTTSTGRLVSRGLFRAFGISAAQAAVVVVLLHTTLGLSWSLAPATAAFAIFLAFVFTAVHHLLTVAFGRAGLVASLVLLALQLVSVGGLYPIELVAAPFRALSPFLPLTWAVQGMQGIISSATTGASGSADIFGAVGILTLFALGSVLLSFWTVARRRGARSFGLAVARA
jgi:putative membrane protein